MNSRNVDTRIVEMQFDNKEFEKGIRTSTTSLSNLKKNLDFTGSTKGLGNLSNALMHLPLQGVANSVEMVTNRFSALEIMGVTALMNITNRATDMAVSLAKSMSVDQVSAGWNKYAEKTSAVQTIMAATAKNFSDTNVQMQYVNDQLNKLNWFTDETSYSFLDMVNNIGKFTSNNIELERSVTAMEGISTWAAVSGANVGEAGRAMYNLSQAIAVGSVKLMDWKSIENANMATAEFKETAIQTAVELGTLTEVSEGLYRTLAGHEVSVQNFNENLKDEWFSSEVLLTTLDKYGKFTDILSNACDEVGVTASEMLQYVDDYQKHTLDIAEATRETGIEATRLEAILDELGKDEYALGRKSFKAAQEAKTFAEAIDSVKDAVSTGWMNTFEIIFGNYQEAKVLWTDLANTLWDVFAGGAEGRNALLRGAFSSGWQQMIDKIQAAGISSEKFTEVLNSKLKVAGMSIEKLTAQYGSLEKAFQSGEVSASYLKLALRELQNQTQQTEQLSFTEMLGMDSTGEEVKKIQETLEALGYSVGKTGVDGIIGQYTTEAIKAFQEANGLEITGIVGEDTIAKMNELTASTEELTFDIDELIDGFDRLGGRELLFQGIANIWNGLVDIAEIFGDAYRKIFPPITSDRLFSIIESFENLTSKFKLTQRQSDQLRYAFLGIISVARFVVDVFKGIFDIAVKVVKKIAPVGNLFLDIAAKIGVALYSVNKWFKSNDIINKFVNSISDGLARGIDFIGNWINKLKEIPVVSNGIKSVNEGLSNGIKTLKDWILKASDMPIEEVFVKGFEKIKKGISSLWTSLKTWFANLKTMNIKEVFSGITPESFGIKQETVDKIKEFFSSSFESIKAFFKMVATDYLYIPEDTITKISGFFDSIIQSVKNFFKSMGDAIVNAGKEAGNGVSNGFTTIGDIFNGIVNTIKGIVGSIGSTVASGIESVIYFFGPIFDLIENIFDFVDDRGRFDLQKFLGVLSAITAFIGIVKVIKTVKSTLNTIGDAINTIGDAINTMSEDLAEKNKIAKMEALSKVILSFAAVIAVIAISIGVLSTLDMGNVITVGVVLSVFIGVILGLLAIIAGITKKSPSTVTGLTLLMASIAGCIIAFAGSLKIIESINPENLENKIVAIAELLLLFAGLVAILVLIQKKSNGSVTNETSLQILAIAASLLIIVYALKNLAEIPDEGIKNGLIAMTLIMAEFGLLFAAVNHFAKDSKDVGISLLAMSVALILIEKTIKNASKISYKDAWHATLVLGMVSLLFIVMAAAMRVAGGAKKGVGTSILAMSVSLLIMIGLIKLVNTMEPEEIIKGTVALTLMSLMFIVLGKAASAAKKTGKNSAKTFIGIAIALGIVSLAIKNLANADTGKVIAATLCLSLIALMMSNMAKNTGKLKKAIPNVLIMALFLGIASAAIIGILAFGDTGSILAATLGLSVVLLAVSKAAQIASKIKVVGALEGVAGIAIFLVGMIAIFGVLGLIIEKLDELTNGGVSEKINQGAEFIGEIIGHLIHGIQNGMKGDNGEEPKSLADKFSEFVDTLMNAIDKVTNMPEGALEAAQGIAELILTLTKAELLDAVAGMIGGKSNFEEFAEGIKSFGEAMKSFADSVKGIEVDEESMQSVIRVGEAIGELYKALPKTGGMIQDFFGEQDMSKFSRGIIQFGFGMRKFGAIFDGVDFPKETLDSVVRIGKSIGEIYKSLPKTDGGIQSIFGEQDMTTFSVGIMQFGAGMRAFALTFNGIDFPKDKLTSVTNIGKALAELNNSLPESDGVLQSWFTGEKDLSKFGDSLIGYGKGLSEFSQSVSGSNAINTKAIDNAVLAGTALKNFQDTLNNIGGLVTTNGGDDFYYNIQSYISAVDNLFTMLDGINIPDNVPIIASSLYEITEGLRGLQVLNGAIGSSAFTSSAVISFLKDLSGIKLGNLKGVNVKLSSLSDTLGKISNYDDSKLQSLITALTTLGSTQVDTTGMQDSMNNAINTVDTSIQNAGSTANSDASEMASGIVSSIGKEFSKADFSKNGGEMIRTLIVGINFYSSAVGTAVRNVVALAAREANTGYSGMFEAGKYMDSGLANGIVFGSLRVQLAARGVMLAAIKAAEDAAKIESPSKVMDEDGRFWDEGLANGIERNGYLASNASEKVMNRTIDSVSAGLREVSRVFDEDVNFSPAIRPVVDLSDVKSGAASIDNMLSSRKTFSIRNAQIGYAATMMDGRNQNGINSDLLSEIKGLRSALGSASSNTYIVNGVTYDDGSNVRGAVSDLVHAIRMERRA